MERRPTSSVDRSRRGRRMNDDLATLDVMGVVMIARIVRVRIVFWRRILLRRNWGDEGKRQRRRPDRRHG